MGCKVRVQRISVMPRYLPSPGEATIIAHAKVVDVDISVSKLELTAAAAFIAAAICALRLGVCPDIVAVAAGLYKLLTILNVDSIDVCYGAGIGLGVEEAPHKVKVDYAMYENGQTLYVLNDWDHDLEVNGYIPFSASIPAIKGSVHAVEAKLRFRKCGRYKVCAYETHLGMLGEVFHEHKKCTYVYVCQKPPKPAIEHEDVWLYGLGALGLLVAGGLVIASRRRR